ncbi:MAG: phage resistance protein [Magnetococcales bacterium]|nr:phage resistance protein [Magnetococcales bacterium]MBF0116836.1 phage resistance protein [Magnetococcales bacterium]
MTLIKELIEIPERVHKGDFVLRLTEGVARAEETLRHYVVTPQLKESFDHAITFIKSAVENRTSKAAYLHGSFGSGKSHFMAVLHLLLQHNPDARALLELSPVVAKHDAWLAGKKLLMVPYHMIGARSMESAILGGFVQHIRSHHPQAGIPGVYLAEELFHNASTLREKMGDASFFSLLNGETATLDDDWGEMDAPWESATFAEALQAPVGSELRSRLVGDLVERLFTAHAGLAASQEEAFVPLDQGLVIISRFARDLGYDGLILFLDELILWLASHVADLKFVNTEIQKVIKLVESGAAGRPVPIISFVARQRDLRELVGEHLPGAQQLSFADILKFWQGRFEIITLEDRNLPVIAEKRILRPKSESARAQLQSAFESSTKVQEAILSTLLTESGDREMFRRVYPFSPALVQALVALSAVLQRERTALKVMIQLLVNQRETLQLGQIVPVGDLYDAIADEAEPFTSEMRHHFENARKLYRQKFLPMLEKEHGLRQEEVVTLPVENPKRRAFLADDRLVKTLMLSALVPAVECFKGLNAPRLAALNHGNVRAPIPGQEAGIVLQKCRKWAGQIGELKIGDEPSNPTLSIQLSGVDIETILDKARSVDNPGSRAEKIREMLCAALAIPESDSLFGVEFTFVWRGTFRTLDVLFANIRDMSDESFDSAEGRWKVIIDFPFDVEGHTPSDDMAALQRYRVRNKSSTTLCWLPSFFSREVQRDLGNLVVMEHLLASEERFRGYADHLSEIERVSAKGLLDNQRSQLRQHILNALLGAYGIATPLANTLDGAHQLADHFQSLDPTFQPRPPVGATLGEGFLHLLDQALAHQFPAHPRFETDLKTGNLRRVLEEVNRALQSSDGRIPIEKTVRQLLRQIANPLQLGQMYENHFVMGNHWKNHFERKIAAHGGEPTVERLRQWTDDPTPMGLPVQVQNLLILIFAGQSNRIFRQRGVLLQPTLENLPNDATLQQQSLPDPSCWEDAVARAASIFGVAASPLCTTETMTKLAQDIQEQRTRCENGCRQLVSRLNDLAKNLSLSGDVPRRRSAESVLALLERLRHAEAAQMVDTLAQWPLPDSVESLGKSLKSAADIVAALDRVRWELLESAWGLTDERQDKAQTSRRGVVDALTRDELVLPLSPVLHEAEREALRLLTVQKTSAPQGPVVTLTPTVETNTMPPAMDKVVFSVIRQKLSRNAGMELLRQIEQQLQSHPQALLTIEVRIESDEGAD